MIAAAFHCSANKQLLLRDVRIHVADQLRRQIADCRRLQTGAVNQRCDFDNRGARQVGNRAVIGYVAVNHAGRAGCNRVNNRAAVFLRAMNFHRLVVLRVLFHALELVDNAVAATQIFVNRHVVFIDGLLAVRHEETRVLGVVLARFRNEISQTTHQFKAHFVAGGLGVVHRVK